MPATKQQQQQQGERLFGGRTSKQWCQLLTFYLFFYGWLIALFAIAYSVMFHTLPSTSEGPKLQNLINPGVVTFPTSITLTGVGNPQAFNASATRQLADLKAFKDSSSVNLGNLDVFGDCKRTLSGNGHALYAALKPCAFAKINRVFGFPDPDTTIAVSVTLDYPSAEEFETTYSISFDDFKSQHITVSPETITGAVPFTNTPVFKDIVSAIQVDLSSYRTEIEGGKEFKFRLGVQFDFGQGLAETGNGFTTVEVDVRK